MKACLIATGLFVVAIASAQYGGGYYGCSNTYYQPVYSFAPQVYYVGGNYRPSPRESNVPFAYAAFFYGQNLQQWQQSQAHRSHGWRRW